MIFRHNSLSAAIRRRMLLITTVVIAVMAGAWYYMIQGDIARSEQRMLASHAQLLAKALRPAVLFHDRQMSTQLLTQLMHDPNSRFRAIAVYDRQQTFQSFGDIAWPSDIDAVRSGHSALYDDTFFVYAPIVMKEQKIGGIYLAAESTLYRDAIHNAQLSTLVAAIFAVLLAVILSHPLHRQVTGPLTKLAETLRPHGTRPQSNEQEPVRLENASGKLWQLEQQLPTATPPEVHQLIRETATMMQRLATQWRAIERSQRTMKLLNADLERQVAARTESYRIAKEEAERLADSRIRFLANMSHEIRTPMNAIIGLLRLTLHEERRLPEYVSDQLRTVLRASDQMLHTIDEVLDFSKIDADAMVITPRAFALDEFTEQIEHLFRAQAIQKGISLVLHAPRGLPPLLGDATRIQQILRNLVSNAIKFTEHGGVTIRISVDAERDQSPVLTASVEDSGIGIRKEDQARLFEPFMQVEDDDQRRFSGTGLGLTICHRLTTLMGGRLALNSTWGRGSCFTLTLPLAWAKPGAIQKPRPATLLTAEHLKPLQGRRILIVEDEPINRKLMTALLRRVGIECRHAESGRSALEIVLNETFDLILMDMQMPEMDGVEATRRLRQITAYAEIPIIATTANVMQDARLACHDAGMNDLITKPIDEQILYGKLLRWITGRETGAIPAAEADKKRTAYRYDNSIMLARLGGDRALQREVLEEFLTRHQQTGEQLQKMITSGEHESARRLAHNLAGLAGTLAARELARCARALMTALADTDQTNIAVHLQQCVFHLQQLIADITSDLQQGDENP